MYTVLAIHGTIIVTRNDSTRNCSQYMSLI